MAGAFCWGLLVHKGFNARDECKGVFVYDNVENLQADNNRCRNGRDTRGLGYLFRRWSYLGYIVACISFVPKDQRTFRGYATTIGFGAVFGALTLTPIGATSTAFANGNIGFVGNQTATKIKSIRPHKSIM